MQKDVDGCRYCKLTSSSRFSELGGSGQRVSPYLFLLTPAQEEIDKKKYFTSSVYDDKRFVPLYLSYLCTLCAFVPSVP